MGCRRHPTFPQEALVPQGCRRHRLVCFLRKHPRVPEGYRLVSPFGGPKGVFEENTAWCVSEGNTQGSASRTAWCPLPFGGTQGCSRREHRLVSAKRTQGSAKQTAWRTSGAQGYPKGTAWCPPKGDPRVFPSGTPLGGPLVPKGGGATAWRPLCGPKGQRS